MGEGTGASPESSGSQCINGVGEGTGAQPTIIINGVGEGTGAKPQNSSQCTVIQGCDNQYLLICNQ